MLKRISLLLCLTLLPLSFSAQTFNPSDPLVQTYQPKPVPPVKGLMLKRGDKVAICGDSITEQRMYSRAIETYLMACMPDLDLSVRQYGWSGEQAPGFLARMTNDCLRFHPTVATTCYGMNDHGYRPYEPSIGDRYKKYSTVIAEAFKAHNVRFVHGSPGCVGKRPNWSKDTNATTEALNKNLCTLRNIGIDIAREENVRFADVFWPMLVAGDEAQRRYATNYAIAGKDGVHPGWAGSFVMAYAFLKSLGLDGDIGTYTVDVKSGKATASNGHEVLSARDGEIRIRSKRYPFCATGETNSDNSIRSAMTLIPFNQELNRLMLMAKNASASKYKVTWGAESRSYSAEQLNKGVNLAADFAVNPFSEAFDKLDKAVAAKQSYETKQIKQVFHELGAGKFKSADQIKDAEMKELFALAGPDGKFDFAVLERETEKKRQPLADAIKAAQVPVEHVISLQPE
ncbi:MAG TPA: SGNH/GDSL hydrolase family protein [Candidatus Binatia bacterium]|nr:SGNH/GDSL hydrolase family protein [Candidatus Binatia bacterium]